MINVETDDYGLHLIGKRKKETHTEVRSELPVPEGCIRILFVYDCGAIQKRIILDKCKLYINRDSY